MKKCLKRVVRSSKIVRTSAVGGSGGYVLMVSTEYRASACTLRETFVHERQCEAWSKKCFIIVSTISASKLDLVTL